MADQRRFVDELVNVVNEYRALHQVEPLRLDPRISSISQRWANHMATTGLFQHNPDGKLDGQPLGENCAMKWSSRASALDYSGREAVDKWYAEIQNYDFERHRGANTGHFTQLVWKSSREIGVGRAQSRDGKWFVVANFFPAGNYVGRYDDNVFPARQQNTLRQTQTRNGRQSTKAIPVNIDRRGVSPSSPFRPISPNPPLFNSSENERYSSKHTTRALRTQPQQSNQYQQQPQPSRLSQQLNQQQKQKSNDIGLDTDYDVLQRNTETKVENGVTRKKVTETRRNRRNGQLSTVVMETMDQQVSDVIRQRVPVVNATMPHANDELSRLEHTVSRPKRAAQNDEEFVDQVLYQHNVYRRLHGNVGSLTLNGELSKMANQWAQYLVSMNSLQHSNTKYGGFDIGENIAMKDSRPAKGKIVYNGREAVKLWYDEIQMYDFDDPEPCAERCGHFTQVIWKGSREIGVGRAFADGGRRVCVVCYYFPPGNFIGKFGGNVLRPSRQS